MRKCEFQGGNLSLPIFWGQALQTTTFPPKKKSYPSKAERNFAAQAKADIEVAWAFRIAGVDVWSYEKLLEALQGIGDRLIPEQLL